MGFAKRTTNFIPSRISEKIAKVASVNKEGEILTQENGRKKVSLTEVITSSFSEVRLFDTWEGLVKDWLQYKYSLLENKWFVDTIFALPKWNSFNDFTLAIETIVKMEPSWQESDWFYTEVFEKYKPVKVLAEKKLSLCHECGKDIYIMKVLNKKTKNIEDIEVNSKLYQVTLQNKDLQVVSQLGELTQLKNVGTGYLLHTNTCSIMTKKNIAYINPNQTNKAKK